MFYGEIWLIISKLSLLPLLIWSTEIVDTKATLQSCLIWSKDAYFVQQFHNAKKLKCALLLFLLFVIQHLFYWSIIMKNLTQQKNKL